MNSSGCPGSNAAVEKAILTLSSVIVNSEADEDSPASKDMCNNTMVNIRFWWGVEDFTVFVARPRAAKRDQVLGNVVQKTEFASEQNQF